MASAFKHFQSIFAVRKAQSLGLFGPPAAGFEVGRGKGGFLAGPPAPFLEAQVFENVGAVVVAQPFREGNNDPDLLQLVLALFSMGRPPLAGGRLELGAAIPPG